MNLKKFEFEFELETRLDTKFGAINLHWLMANITPLYKFVLFRPLGIQKMLSVIRYLSPRVLVLLSPYIVVDVCHDFTPNEVTA